MFEGSEEEGLASVRLQGCHPPYIEGLKERDAIPDLISLIHLYLSDLHQLIFNSVGEETDGALAVGLCKEIRFVSDHRSFADK